MSGDAKAWAALDRELDAWGAAGRTATLWWRDDDAVAPSPELDRLLALAATCGAPLALAVIPAAAEDALAARLEGQAAEIAVLQHGCAHRNLAAAGGKKCELVDPAARPGLPAELRQGRPMRGTCALALMAVARSAPSTNIPCWTIRRMGSSSASASLPAARCRASPRNALVSSTAP
jgi:hypothetical protein